MFQVKNLTVTHKKDLTALIEGLSFTLSPGDRAAVIGEEGNGKSTLLRLLYDPASVEPYAEWSGEIVNQGLRKGFLAQELSPDELALPVWAFCQGVPAFEGADPKALDRAARQVGLDAGLFWDDRPMSTLSGGERSRLALAVLFLARCNLLVLDEPTNHLDLESREALIEALDNFDGTLLVVAHDRHLLAEVVDEIWEITDRGIHVYEGGFEEYDAARHAAKAAEKAERAAAAESQGGTTGLSRDDLKRIKREQGEQRNALYKKLKPLQEKYKKDEAEMEQTLTRLGEVENLLADPDVYADGAKASALLKEFHKLQTKSERQLETLSELEEQISVMEAQRAALSLGADD